MGEWSVMLDGSTIPTKEEVGGKAHGIARMRRHGLPVPPAFALPTRVGRVFIARGGLPDEAWAAALDGIRELEQATGRTFGGTELPLLVSVRSGAAHSMPGMMDTILNLRINDDVEAALRHESDDQEFARDTHRRFIDSYAKTVLRAKLDAGPEAIPADLRAAAEKLSDRALPEDPHNLVHEGITEPEAALKAVRPEHVQAALQPVIDAAARKSAQVLARGDPACPGVGSGLAVGSADEAVSLAEDGTSVILVTRSTTPADVHGMIAAKGVVTEVGGRTSHAAVVSRELGLPATDPRALR